VYDTVSEDDYDFAYVFEDLKSTISKSNINAYSQQSIIGGKDLGMSLNYNYNSPVQVADAMIDIGFNAVNLANYHAFDKGVQGITNSLNYWNEKEVINSGTSLSEEDRLKNNTITKNGIRYTMLSYTTGTDTTFEDKYLIDIYSEELVKNDIEKVKNNSDLIIVFIDWSDIKSYEVTDKQKEIVSFLVSQGVNIIIGNTGFSVQPIEFIGDTLVCYSLGNLLSGHIAIDSRISAVVDFDVTLKKRSNEKVIEFGNVDVLLTYAYNNANTNYKILPFSKITNQLNNYQSYYDKYKEVVTRNSDRVNVYEIGEVSGD